jgi:hypothetical protein
MPTALLICLPVCRSLSIVQQNQIKKARKLQEDAKAEQDRLVSGVHAAGLVHTTGQHAWSAWQ